MSNNIQLTFACNQVSAHRVDLLNNEEHLVVPVVAMKEGVMNDYFYSAEDINNYFETWNNSIATVDHPENVDKANGFSANNPSMINRIGVGHFLNARSENKSLKGEVWINTKQAIAKGFEYVVNRLKNGEVMDVSVGVNAYKINEDGSYNGKKYIAKVTNLRLDHLALLPNSKGACSSDDGCGTHINDLKNNEDVQMSKENVSNCENAKNKEETSLLATTLKECKDFFSNAKKEKEAAEKAERDGLVNNLINNTDMFIEADRETLSKADIKFLKDLSNKLIKKDEDKPTAKDKAKGLNNQANKDSKDEDARDTDEDSQDEIEFSNEEKEMILKARKENEELLNSLREKALLTFPNLRKEFVESASLSDLQEIMGANEMQHPLFLGKNGTTANNAKAPNYFPVYSESEDKK